MRRAAFTLFALLAACAVPPPAAEPAPAVAPEPSVPPLAPELGSWIDAYVSSFGKLWGDDFAFTGYVLLTQAGKPVFAKGYGKANRATGAVPDGDTRFRIGSITKQFTAVAILQLAEAGKLRTEDPLSKYFPELPFAKKVTLHHLLTHTSGIFSYTDDEALMDSRDRPRTHAEVVATFAGKPLLFEPGSAFRYSNSNYFLLGMVLEKVTGKSYEDYLRANVLGPAGMTRTGTVDAPDAPNTAVGYTEDDDRIVPAHAVDMSTPFSAGALRSTANDLARWDRALASGVLLSTDAEQRRVSAVKDGYAYGVEVETVAGRHVEEHGGGIDGFYSSFARVPSEHLAVIVLTNTDQFPPDHLAAAVLEMALTGAKLDPPKETPVVPFDAASIARFSGDYALDPASAKEYAGKLPDAVLAKIGTLTFAADGGHLRFKPNGDRRREVFLREDGVLFTKRGAVIFESEQREGPVTSFFLRQGRLSLRYAR